MTRKMPKVSEVKIIVDGGASSKPGEAMLHHFPGLSGLA
jgi:hypothetical protein